MDIERVIVEILFRFVGRKGGRRFKAGLNCFEGGGE